MPESLDPSGRDVYVGDFTLRTPGLSGSVDVLRAAPPVGTRAEGTAPGVLDEALGQEHVRSLQALSFSDTSVEPEQAARDTRSTARGEPALEIEAPAPAEGWEQALLVTDANGTLSWHVGIDGPAGTEPSRGSGTRTYVIPRPDEAGRIVGEVPDGEGTRSVIGKGALKLVRLVAFKLIDPIAGKVGPYFVRNWEKKKRPYSLRLITEADYREQVVTEPEAADWNRLGEGRALLLIHGTSSRTDIAFSGLDPAFVAEMRNVYGGRVFGFDHPTLASDPVQNAKRFVGAMPDGAKLDLDIICHSRGGLVSRLLAERQGDLGLADRRLDIRRLVFVATPNAGTSLSDMQHVQTFIDAFTNLLTHIPDGFEPVAKAAEALAGVITVLKQFVAGTVKNLDGLQSMNPRGEFLKRLNVDGAGRSRYFALSANYEPTEAALMAFVKDRLADLIFQNEGNDLIVPTAGVYADNGSGLFPIGERHEFSSDAGIAHTSFFSQPAVRDKLREWLAA